MTGIKCLAGGVESPEFGWLQSERELIASWTYNSLFAAVFLLKLKLPHHKLLPLVQIFCENQSAALHNHMPFSLIVKVPYIPTLLLFIFICQDHTRATGQANLTGFIITHLD